MSEQKTKSPYALEVRNLTRSFGPRKILSDVSFKLKHWRDSDHHGRLRLREEHAAAPQSSARSSPMSGRSTFDGTEITKLDDEADVERSQTLRHPLPDRRAVQLADGRRERALPILESSDVSPASPSWS